VIVAKFQPWVYGDAGSAWPLEITWWLVLGIPLSDRRQKNPSRLSGAAGDDMR